MKRLILFLVLVVLMVNVGIRGYMIGNSKPGFIIISTVENYVLTDFVNFKQEEYEVRVVNINEIQKSSKGVDLPEQIRNWLKNNVTEQDKYLLLIGEPSGKYTWNSTGGDLPMRIAYPLGKSWEYRVPTDFYYADLVGNWDKDKDLIYGEFEDYEINWKPDLIVGRIPTSNPSLIKIILENTIEFEKKEKENIKHKKACIAMTMRFWEGSQPSEGDWSILGEQLRNLLETNIEVITLYEKEGDYISSFNCFLPLNKENFENNIKNSDIAIVSYRTREVWKDKNSNKEIEQNEIQSIEYFDRSLNIETPISLFWLSGAFGADPLWKDSPLINFLVSRKIISGVGFTSLALSVADWKNLENGRYAQSFTYLFTRNLGATGQIVIGEAMFKTFEQYYNIYSPLNEYDYMLLGFEFLGDPTLELKIDTTPPDIKIISPTEEFTNQKKILLKGEVKDSSMIASLSVNDEIVEVKENSFEKEITLQEGENEIEIIAIDKVGNKTKMKILIECDTTPPEIVCSIPEKVDNEFFTIKGSVKDKNIVQMTINKKEIALKENTFQYTISLSEGNNIVIIEAEDIAGNRTTKSFNIEYIKRTILKLQIGNKTMYVNDTPQGIDIPPIIIEGRTLLPIRWVAEPLGARVEWDGVERKVTIALKDTVIELWIDKNIARVNGFNTLIDPDNPKVVPIIKDGRTMLPVRFIAENLGCKVDWDQDTKTVTITYPKD